VRLGWDEFRELVRPMVLENLDRDGVAEALSSMGIAIDEGAADLVDQVLRLTSGDPLEVGFYAEDIWRQQKGHLEAGKQPSSFGRRPGAGRLL
jgi:hypothetical protein